MQTITAKELKANCSKILDQIASGEIPVLTVLKDGQPVATLRTPTSAEATRSVAAKLRNDAAEN
jgi:antitoxin (DNA-binding transcriptional repressor) of toxin-antitoxin stability system